jgi:hypothetical protein
MTVNSDVDMLTSQRPVTPIPVVVKLVSRARDSNRDAFTSRSRGNNHVHVEPRASFCQDIMVIFPLIDDDSTKHFKASASYLHLAINLLDGFLFGQRPMGHPSPENYGVLEYHEVLQLDMEESILGLRRYVGGTNPNQTSVSNSKTPFLIPTYVYPALAYTSVLRSDVLGFPLGTAGIHR